MKPHQKTPNHTKSKPTQTQTDLSNITPYHSEPNHTQTTQKTSIWTKKCKNHKKTQEKKPNHNKNKPSQT